MIYGSEEREQYQLKISQGTVKNCKNPNITSTQRLGFTQNDFKTTNATNNHPQKLKVSVHIDPILMKLFIGTFRKVSNAHGDICPDNICTSEVLNCFDDIYPDNICPGDICPYQKYLSCQ